MKDKTHTMNMGYSAQEAADGFERLADGSVPQRRKYKREQLKDAGLLNDKALSEFENQDGDEGASSPGFLPRNNYSDRF